MASTEEQPADKRRGRLGAADQSTASPEAVTPPGERAPESHEHPTSVWICENSNCRFFGVRRRVRWQHLGAGLYLVGTVRCHCGHLPSREPRTR